MMKWNKYISKQIKRNVENAGMPFIESDWEKMNSKLDAHYADRDKRRKRYALRFVLVLITGYSIGQMGSAPIISPDNYHTLLAPARQSDFSKDTVKLPSQSQRSKLNGQGTRNSTMSCKYHRRTIERYDEKAWIDVGLYATNTSHLKNEVLVYPFDTYYWNNSVLLMQAYHKPYLDHSNSLAFNSAQEQPVSTVERVISTKDQRMSNWISESPMEGDEQRTQLAYNSLIAAPAIARIYTSPIAPENSFDKTETSSQTSIIATPGITKYQNPAAVPYQEEFTKALKTNNPDSILIPLVKFKEIACIDPDYGNPGISEPPLLVNSNILDIHEPIRAHKKLPTETSGIKTDKKVIDKNARKLIRKEQKLGQKNSKAQKNVQEDHYNEGFSLIPDYIGVYAGLNRLVRQPTLGTKWTFNENWYTSFYFQYEMSKRWMLETALFYNQLDNNHEFIEEAAHSPLTKRVFVTKTLYLKEIGAGINAQYLLFHRLGISAGVNWSTVRSEMKEHSFYGDKDDSFGTPGTPVRMNNIMLSVGSTYHLFSWMTFSVQQYFGLRKHAIEGTQQSGNVPNLNRTTISLSFRLRNKKKNNFL